MHAPRHAHGRYVPHQEVSVLIPLTVLLPGGVGVLGYLRALPDSTVRRLYRNVLRARHRVQYSPFDNTPGGDALDAAMQHVREALVDVRGDKQTSTIKLGAARDVVQDYVCGRCDQALWSPSLRASLELIRHEPWPFPGCEGRYQ